MVNSQRGPTGLVRFTNLISNKREWNNCFIKFGAFLYFEINSLILVDFFFTKRPEVDVQKQQQVGNHMTCAVCKIS